MLSDWIGDKQLVVTAQKDSMAYVLRGNSWTPIYTPEYPRGITETADGYAIACGAEISYFDRGGALIVGMNLGFDQPHEIVEDDGALWVTDPVRSAVAKFQNFDYSYWLPAAVPAVVEEMRTYLTGFAFADGRPRYVTALGISNIADGWHNGMNTEEGALIDYETREPVLQDLSMPHSPRVRGDEVWFCNSAYGELCTWKPGDETRSVRANHDGFLRGLRFLDDGEHALVGVSQVRNTGASYVHVNSANPGVAVFELGTGQLVDFEHVPVQEIFDLCLVDAP